ncbi:hypothetical protein BJ912DRAFT_60760 [Pholiota molesta]|nr:hypothetical protein BJ912DRAFT_60760 [Pholiota molesta]
MANSSFNPPPLSLPPIHATPRRNAGNLPAWRTPNATRALGLNQQLTGTPRPISDPFSSQRDYGFQSFPSMANPSTIPAAHPFAFGAQDNIPASPQHHFGRYKAENPSDPALNWYHRPPLLPIQNSNPPCDPGFDPPRPLPSQAPGTRHVPTSKVGGSRRKRVPSPPPQTSHGKGKRRRVDFDVDEPSEALTDSEDERPVVPATGHGGRRAGAGNYKDSDLTELLNLTQKELPVGQRGWQRIHKAYAVWAKLNSRPVRDARSLELKFKSLAKQTKPTGAGKRPAAVTRAKAIDGLINERISTRSLNDSEIEGDANFEDDPLIKTEDSPKVLSATIRSNKAESDQPPRRNARAMQSADLMQKLSSALDPDMQRTRDEERATRSFQNTQIFTLTQQLRDSQATNETLRREATELHQQIHKLERQLDRAQFKLMMAGGRDRRPVPSQKREKKDRAGFVRVRGKVRHDEFFPEGGSYTTWITDGSSATDWSESDKENFGPYPQVHPLSPPFPSLPRVSTPYPSLSPPLQPRGSPRPQSSPQAHGATPEPRESSEGRVFKPQHRRFKLAPPASRDWAANPSSSSASIAVPSSPSPKGYQPACNLGEGPSAEVSAGV